LEGKGREGGRKEGWMKGPLDGIREREDEKITFKSLMTEK
jgi:hypothetical protein